MNILITGGSGFLGKTINDYLKSLKELSIYNLGRSEYNEIVYDLNSDKLILDTNFELVVHAAGKAHSNPTSEYESNQFFNINYKGTLNLLDALKKSPPKYFVFISSVSVYGIIKGELINEESELLASDPYGKSKILAEKAIIEWCKEYDVVCTIFRLPLIIGKNPLGNLKSMIEGIKKGYYFNIQGGTARKSMVLAEDIAKYIPIACKVGGVYNLTDKTHPNFNQLSKHIAKILGKNRIYNMPLNIAKLLSKIGDVVGHKFPINSQKLLKITSELTFDDTKASNNFGWNPKPVLTNFKIE